MQCQQVYSGVSCVPSHPQQRRKMRLFVSHAFHNLPSAGGEAGADSQSVPEWELKIEGRPLDEVEPVSAHIVYMIIHLQQCGQVCM